MRYSTVKIRPKAFSDGGWIVTFEDLPHDRESGEGTMSGLGFFHYPRKIGKKEAFRILKNHMIEKHQQEINRLQKSMESIKKLEMKEVGNE